NISKLPGLVGNAMAMPDAHQGFGFPIGGVAAFDLEKGIISPGGVGYDINCGVRILTTNLTRKDIQQNQKKILEKLYLKIPSGLGKGSPFQISKKQLDEILEKGVNFLIKKGYGKKEDALHIEDNGNLKGDARNVSERAKKRGIGQLGTLGAGNHFLEVQYVDEIFDEKIAKKFGLNKNQAVIMIHCGSRGLGHQVASDYISKMEKEYGLKNLPDKELVNAPIKSKLGQEYLSAMNCASNFAFSNRQVITHWVREVFEEIIPKSDIDILYDICHNIAKIEKHGSKEVCIHRKGATRNFDGQLVLIPGSMGTSSYVMVGTKKSEELTFSSSAHGAGRVLSRSKAIKTLDGEKVREEIEKKGIMFKTGSEKSLIEEAPEVYKDIEEVIKTIEELDLSKKVARLKPLVVVKG
ncbi:MAG: RtcB family protein, partial [Nanoarchaeota archaeon]|nr:RtcB family protein [Nanoarchaeota archaeon]